MSDFLQKALGARMQEYDFAAEMQDNFAADRDRFGEFLLMIMHRNEVAGSDRLRRKDVILAPDSFSPVPFKLLAFEPLTFDDGQVTIRTGFTSRPGEELFLGLPISFVIEIAQFDDGHLDVPFGAPDRMLASVDSSRIPQTPLGEVRTPEVLNQLKLITHSLLLWMGAAAPEDLAPTTGALAQTAV